MYKGSNIANVFLTRSMVPSFHLLSLIMSQVNKPKEIIKNRQYYLLTIPKHLAKGFIFFSFGERKSNIFITFGLEFSLNIYSICFYF